MLGHPVLELLHECRPPGMARAFEERAAVSDIAAPALGGSQVCGTNPTGCRRPERRRCRVSSPAECALASPIHDTDAIAHG